MNIQLVFDGEDELLLDITTVSTERLVRLFQTTSIYRDVCNEMRINNPDIETTYHQIANSCNDMYEALSKELGEDTALILIANILAEIQLEKCERLS